MSTEATGAAAPRLDLDRDLDLDLGIEMGTVTDSTATADIEMDDSTIAVVHPAQLEIQPSKPTGLHSPPDSNNDNDLKLDGSDSELSDLDDAITADFREEEEREQKEKEKEQQEQQQQQGPEEEEDDIGEVLPDHWSGTVPVFRPTMHQFKDFKKFMTKIDSCGMKSGIVKVIPPQEWKDSLPALDELVKQVKVKEPIKQDIMGSNGTYRQVNILHQRSYNLPQWRQLCDQSEHQPPARRGERRANADKPKPAPRARPAPSTTSNSPATKKGRGRRGRANRSKPKQDTTKEGTVDPEDRPMTPVSPKPEGDKDDNEDKVVESVEQDPGIKEEEDEDCDDTPTVRRMGGFSRQAKPKMQSTSARRKYSKREGSAKIDEAAFKDWDYRMDVSDYTPERCEELERIYWKTLTYAPPLYGADLMGTLFDEATDCWNLNKLPNLLDVLGTKVPGVNTAYLYLGMWKATFAWHLEDVDLYSINYLHFGAPKQWYSISQGDARRFEAAMKSIWPTDAKACDQFLRHKAFLISPAHLQQHYNIKVNKCVSYPGEFVVTYPYGYHSGYNLGYNCAEAVNFALDSWLPMGKIAKKCECAQAQDSVWVDVYEIERKLRGESTEYEETEDEDEDEEEDDEATGLPSPPSSHAVRIRAPGKKRKRVTIDKDGKIKTKKIRLKVKAHAEPPCCLCPNDIPGAEILPTDDGRKAHRMCALYLPETYIETEDGKEVVTNAANIDKARLDLKCLYCRSKKGACFQCSQKKCARSYHATCAAAAGVFIEEAEVPVFGEDGTEYKEQAFEFSCRFHRTKRDKKLDGDALEENGRVQEAAAALKKGEICQMQYFKGDIFAGVVVENRLDERTLLLDIIPNGDRVEVDSKWLLLPDPTDFHLPKASPNALPLPTTKKAKDKLNAKRQTDDSPRAEDPFVDGFTWAEFHTCEAQECSNKAQVKVDMAKQDQVWHYLGKTSTESKAQYTEDPRKPQHNLKSNFLDSIPKPPPPQRPQPRTSYGASHAGLPGAQKAEKPYVYKPRKPAQTQTSYNSPYTSLQFVPRTGPTGQQLSFGTDPRYNNQPSYASATLVPVAAKPGIQAQPGQPLSAAPGQFNAGGAFKMSQVSQQQHVGAQPAAQQPLQFAWQKYSFFHVLHNRDSSRYRTPYSTWGGFTNGYEGSLRNYLMSKPEALFKDRRLSFGLGGGLQGLTRPPLHNYTSSTGSSASSIYSTSHSRSKSGAISPSSSHGSGHKPSSMSPPPFPTKSHRRLPSAPSAPLHPAIRPQFGAAWQNTYNHNVHQSAQGKLSGTTTPHQPSRLGPALPVQPSSVGSNTAGSPPVASMSSQPQQMNGHGTSTSTPSPAPYSVEQENGVHQSPEQQLQQQLRRISDPRQSPFRRPHSSRGSSRGHTPRSSLSQVPLFPPQSPPRVLKQEQRPPQATPDYSLAANGVNVREFPEVAEVQPDSMALVERMMLNLRRVSEKGAAGT